MRVLVAGATGAIGRPLVRRLREAGHEALGLTRTPQGAERLRAAGAEPVVADALDREGVTRAVRDAAGSTGLDALIDQMTDLPVDQTPRGMRKALAATNAVRRQGGEHVLGAASAAGATRVIAQSCAFYCAPSPTLATGDDPLWLDAPGAMAEGAAGMADLERRTVDAGGLVLRYGFFHGPGTWYDADAGNAATMVRKRRLPILGSGAGVWSFVHVEDAAAATVAALERDVTGVLAVVDDHPRAMGEWLPAWAKQLGAPPPRRLPLWLGRLVAGPEIAFYAERVRGADAGPAHEALGWRAEHPPPGG